MKDIDRLGRKNYPPKNEDQSCKGKREVIYEQRERVFHRDIQTRENNGVFVHYFRVFVYPGGTRARVVHMASQMNRDVTGCFSLLT